MATPKNSETQSGVPEMKHLLRVYLSSRTITTETIPETYRDLFISGKGLGAALLFDELSANVDPLSPENLLFTFGPLTGQHRAHHDTVR